MFLLLQVSIHFNTTWGWTHVPLQAIESPAVSKRPPDRFNKRRLAATSWHRWIQWVYVNWIKVGWSCWKLHWNPSDPQCPAGSEQNPSSFSFLFWGSIFWTHSQNGNLGWQDIPCAIFPRSAPKWACSLAKNTAFLGTVAVVAHPTCEVSRTL